MKENKKKINNYIVIGGEGLLGGELVKAIYNSGANTIIADKSIEKNTKLDTESINKIYKYNIDITKRESILKCIEYIHENIGVINGVINCSYPKNKNYGKKLDKINFKDFCENINLHIGGYFLILQQFSEYLSKNGGGVIINFGSIYGSFVPRFNIYKNTDMHMPVEYAAIKSSILHLSKYFAKYYKKNNVRVNCISPGGIFDNQHELFIKAYNNECGANGILDKNDINQTLLFLLSDGAKKITGQNIIVDDGFTL